MSKKSSPILYSKALFKMGKTYRPYSILHKKTPDPPHDRVNFIVSILDGLV